ncbi:MAG TPA: BTAD domain-containing putative transcriptional regulator [Rugosimonospora sp.]|nr:BTAD domain-containing putative transcriptional regulator [Rugosimonospora sp.]
MPEPGTSLRAAILGPVQVYRGPTLVDLGPFKQRAVFAVLALSVGHTVRRETICDAIWGRNQPASARQLVHTYVARLRRVLEPDMPPHRRMRMICSAPGGYRLAIGRDAIDLTRFRVLREQARRYLAVNESARAFNLLDEALRMWRDPSLSELGGLLRTEDAVEALRGTWFEAALEYVGTGLKLGEAPTVLPVARQLVAAQPMHEGVQARYLSALAQTGQRAAAIQHFNDVRMMLSDELGVAPGPELASAYHSVVSGRRPPVARGPVVVTRAPVRPPWRGPGPTLGPLIHREPDLDVLARILTQDRLLTICGPPGCGKSVLALQVAARLRDEYLGGVAVLECSRIGAAGEFERALVRLLDGTPTTDTPAKLLSDRRLLLVLDNVEHLVDSCAGTVDAMVRACGHLTVVVTSREPLGLPYGGIWRLHTLAVPPGEEPSWIGDRPAVQLFARRAAQVCPGFRLTAENAEAVAALCHRLDDLPLAIEVAAVCLATDTLDELTHRLDGPLRELRPARRGGPDHHRSLWTVLRHSLDCLTDEERWCFLRLAELPRSFTSIAAAAVWQRTCGTPVDTKAMLAVLVDKSLLYVRRDPDGSRYCMLGLLHRFAEEVVAAEPAHAGAAVTARLSFGSAACGAIAAA